MALKTFFIFDLDGTLFDTAGDLAVAVNKALSTHGARTLPPETIRSFLGNGALNLVRRSLAGTSANLEAVYETFMEFYAGHCTEHTHPMPGVLEMLQKKPYRAALLTNKPSTPTYRILDHFGITAQFETILCGDTSPERKPSPKGFLHILEKAGVPVEKAIMVGDDSPDILGAQAAGMESVYIENGYGSIEGISPVKPTYSIPHFTDLLTLNLF